MPTECWRAKVVSRSSRLEDEFAYRRHVGVLDLGIVEHGRNWLRIFNEHLQWTPTESS